MTKIDPLSYIGDAKLSQKSLSVTEFNADLHSLVDRLFATMEHHNGVGIAAPQIGVNLRVIVFGFKKNARYPNEKPIPKTTLINPEYEVLSKQLIPGWEGCLSVPGLRGRIDRFEKIRYWGVNQYQEPVNVIASGFHARIIQHEVDHLDGILFPFRVRDTRYLKHEQQK